MRTPPDVAAVSLKLKSSAATETSSLLAPAADFQAAREIAQLAKPVEGRAQVPLHERPLKAQIVPVESASLIARPLPALKR